MHSTHAPTTSGLWTSYVRRMMDPDHRLVLRWCAHLDFEDVLRIDHGSIHAAQHDPARSLGNWLVVFGNGRLRVTIVPIGLVQTTQRRILERWRETGVVARHDIPVFGQSYGEPITRASLAASIRRAITLVRLSDALLANALASVATSATLFSAAKSG